MQYSHLTKCSEGAAREDQQSLTWTRTDTSQCEVTEAVGWMVEVVPWKRGQNTKAPRRLCSLSAESR